MKKTIIILIVLALAGVGVYFYQKNAKQAKAPVEEGLNGQKENSNQAAGSPAEDLVNSQAAGAGASSSAPAASTKQPQTTKPSTGTFSSGEEGMSPDIQVWQINYDGSAFEPSVLEIKLGDIVIFKNNSSASFWPASDPHPAHTVYPEFDAGKAIAAGSKFQFQFTKAGSFGFHDHLNQAVKGTVKVTQ